MFKMTPLSSCVTIFHLASYYHKVSTLVMQVVDPLNPYFILCKAVWLFSALTMLTIHVLNDICV